MTKQAQNWRKQTSQSTHAHTHSHKYIYYIPTRITCTVIDIGAEMIMGYWCMFNRFSRLH